MIINSILSAVKSVYSGSSAKRLTKGLYEFNRLISFDAYEKGARYCVKMLKEVGAEKVELHSFLSDGKKMYGNWRSPEVWCIKSGYLELKLSNKWVRFADYPKIPTSVFTYAAPTNGIIETELVSLSTASLEGKLCFCDPTEENINTLIKGKATGIATDFAPNWENVRGPEDFRNGHRWDNSSLFEFTKERLAGFSLNRNQGKKIRALLDSGKSIPCRFKISGKLGSGKIYAVSAIIKGKTNPKEEAVCVAHLYEAGANDNASGVAGSIEGIRTLVSLIKKGKIARPERTIRVVFAFEIVGFMAYFEKIAKEKRGYIAGVNPDMIGENQAKCRSTLHLYRTPLALASFADALLGYYIKTMAENKLAYTTRNYIVNDNVVSDSAIGIPCPALIHLRDKFYHSNLDDMSKVSSDTLYRIGTAMTAYLYAAASLNSSTANEIASLCVNEAIERLRSTCTPFLLEIEEARIKKIATATGLVLDSEINRLKAALQTDLAAANSNSIDNKQLENNPVFKKVAYRTVIGPMTLEHLSLLQRKKYRIQPAWSGKWHLALSWINGKRNLGEIFRNAASETTGLTIEDFLEYFTMLEKEKLISLKLPDAKSF